MGHTPLYRAASCERREGFGGEAISAILLAGSLVPTGMVFDIVVAIIERFPVFCYRSQTSEEGYFEVEISDAL